MCIRGGVIMTGATGIQRTQAMLLKLVLVVELLTMLYLLALYQFPTRVVQEQSSNVVDDIKRDDVVRENLVEEDHTKKKDVSRDILARFEARRRRVNDTCHKYRDEARSKWTWKATNLYYNQEHKLMVCLNPKAGSSTWREYFGRMLHRKPSHWTPLHKIRASNIVGLQHVDQHLQNATRVMVVRHPLERLLSAYRDFFLNNRIKKYYAANGTMKHNAADMGLVKKKPSDVTFGEFLELVLLEHKRGNADKHWNMMHFICSPCTAAYHYFVRLETLKEDRHFLSKELHIPELFDDIHQHRHNPNTSEGVQHNDGQQTDVASREQGSRLRPDSLAFYRSVSVALLRRVFSLVKRDAEMFGYDLPTELTQ